MSAPRRIPQICGATKRRPGETWQNYAMRLTDAGWSSRQIGGLLGKHHTTVLSAINPEFRRDKILFKRRLAAARTPEDIRIDNLAHKVRRAMAAEARA